MPSWRSTAPTRASRGGCEVIEALGGERAWEGEVLVFELLDHPRSPRCYVWELGGEVTAILHDELVDSPRAAVREAVRFLGGS